MTLVMPAQAGIQDLCRLDNAGHKAGGGIIFLKKRVYIMRRGFLEDTPLKSI